MGKNLVFYSLRLVATEAFAQLKRQKESVAGVVKILCNPSSFECAEQRA